MGIPSKPTRSFIWESLQSIWQILDHAAAGRLSTAELLDRRIIILENQVGQLQGSKNFAEKYRGDGSAAER